MHDPVPYFAREVQLESLHEVEHALRVLFGYYG
jgi:hypothetical protein